MASAAPTERITVSSPPFSQHARAATAHHARTRSMVVTCSTGPLMGTGSAIASCGSSSVEYEGGVRRWKTGRGGGGPATQPLAGEHPDGHRESQEQQAEGR